MFLFRLKWEYGEIQNLEVLMLDGEEREQENCSTDEVFCEKDECFSLFLSPLEYV